MGLCSTKVGIGILVRGVIEIQAICGPLVALLWYLKMLKAIASLLHWLMASLLCALTPGELRDAVAAPPSVVLTPFLANYIAAMVEYGCARNSIAPPAWTRTVVSLDEPAFGTTLLSLRLHLLRHSPPPFRRRNIFIDSTPGGQHTLRILAQPGKVSGQDRGRDDGGQAGATHAEVRPADGNSGREFSRYRPALAARRGPAALIGDFHDRPAGAFVRSNYRINGIAKIAFTRTSGSRNLCTPRRLAGKPPSSSGGGNKQRQGSEYRARRAGS